MASATKRLRRETTVSQKGCSELMMLTSDWWMQFLLPVGRYMSMSVWRWAYRGAWIWVWRLLSKEWREVWDQGIRVKFNLHEDRVSNLCHAARCYGDLKFSRDSCNKIKYFECGGRYCMVSMPWNTFLGLRTILSRMAKDVRAHPSFSVHSFVQTAFCPQSEL